MYEDKKKKKIEDDIWEIQNQYPYLDFDRDRHKFNKSDVNKLNKLYSKLRKIKIRKIILERLNGYQGDDNNE